MVRFTKTLSYCHISFIISDNFNPPDLDLYLPFLSESNFNHTWSPPDNILDEVITSVFFNEVPPFAYEWIPPGNVNYRGDGILAAIQPPSENGDTPEEMWKAKYEESIRNQIFEGVISSIAPIDREGERAQSQQIVQGHFLLTTQLSMMQ